MKYLFNKRIVFLLVLALSYFQSNSQSIDSGFHPFIKGLPLVRALAAQNDGKFLVGGKISFAEKRSTGDIVRLNSDGTTDSTYRSALLDSGDPFKIVILPENRSLILQYSSQPTVLMPNGQVDSGFNRSAALFSIVYDAASIDDKILISGSALDVGTVLRRIKLDGEIDLSFTDLEIDAGGIQRLTIQNDGKAIITGNFSSLRGQPYKGIARINTDGSIDSTFDPGTGLDGTVKDIKVMEDSTIIMVGNFNFYNDVPVPFGLVKLNSDGSINDDFMMDGVSSESSIKISSFDITNDSKLIVQGGEAYINSKVYFKLFRINADGSIDYSFSPSILESNFFSEFEIRVTSDEVVCAGGFIDVNGIRMTGFAKFDNLGNLKESVNPRLGDDPQITAATQLVSGKLIIGGIFTEVFDSLVNNIVQLNEDGTIDHSFKTDIDFGNSRIGGISYQSDGKIILFGYLKLPSGTKFVIRLNRDGSLDETFNSLLQPSTFISVSKGLYITDEDKIILSGRYYNSDASPVPFGLVRLNSNGSLDDTFNINNFVDPSMDIRIMRMDGTGNIYLGGRENFNEAMIYKADSAGNPASGFAFSHSANSYPTALTVFNSDTILWGGFYLSGWSNASSNWLNVMETGGLSKSSESVALIGESIFKDIYKINNNDLLIAGSFNMVNSTERSGLVRVSKTGTIDPKFKLDLNGSATGIITYANDKVYVYGNFSTVNQYTFPGIVRLNLENEAPIISGLKENLMMYEDSTIALEPKDFLITDLDNPPSGDLMIIPSIGENYSLNDNLIIPDINFYGTLSIGVKAFDNLDYSDVFSFDLNVLPVNDKPIILGLVKPISFVDSLTITLDEIIVEDPDNLYPDDFTLNLSNGVGYTAIGNTIYSISDQSKVLLVSASVNDGAVSSEPFNLPIELSVVLGLEGIVTDLVNIYPNPARETITIDYKEIKKNEKFLIYDASGTLFIEGNMKTKIYVGQLVPGTYFLVLTRGDKPFSISRFIRVD